MFEKLHLLYRVLMSKFFRLSLMALVGVFILVPQISQAIIAPKPPNTTTDPKTDTTTTPKTSTAGNPPGVTGDPIFAVRNLKAAFGKESSGRCNILLTWAEPDMGVILAKLSEFDSKYLKYKVYTKKSSGTWTSYEIPAGTSSYLLMSAQAQQLPTPTGIPLTGWLNGPVTCDETYDISVITYYPKSTEMARVTKKGFKAQAPFQDTAGCIADGCNVTVPKGWIDNSSPSAGQIEATAHLQWDMPDTDSCSRLKNANKKDIEECAFIINGVAQPCYDDAAFNLPGWINLFGGSQGNALLGVLTSYKNNKYQEPITTKTPYVIKTKIGNIESKGCTITLDPGKPEAVNPDPDAPGGEDAVPDTTESLCDKMCPKKSNWFNVGDQLFSAICQLQCVILSWVIDLLNWIATNMLISSLGL